MVVIQLVGIVALLYGSYEFFYPELIRDGPTVLPFDALPEPPLRLGYYDELVLMAGGAALVWFF